MVGLETGYGIKTPHKMWLRRFRRQSVSPRGIDRVVCSRGRCRIHLLSRLQSLQRAMSIRQAVFPEAFISSPTPRFSSANYAKPMDSGPQLRVHQLAILQWFLTATAQDGVNKGLVAQFNHIPFADLMTRAGEHQHSRVPTSTRHAI